MLKKLLTELLEEVRQAPLPASSGFHQALEVNLQVLVAQTQRVHALDEIVQAKADPVTHKSFQSVLEASNVSSLTSHFWAEAAGRAEVVGSCIYIYRYLHACGHTHTHTYIYIYTLLYTSN